MALKIVCDGCEGAIAFHARDARHGDGCHGCREGHDGHTVGRLDPVAYCDACDVTWRAYEDAERHARLRAVADFEAWQRHARPQARHALRKLPDDWDAPDTGGEGDQ